MQAALLSIVFFFASLSISRALFSATENRRLWEDEVHSPHLEACLMITEKQDELFSKKTQGGGDCNLGLTLPPSCPLILYSAFVTSSVVSAEISPELFKV